MTMKTWTFIWYINCTVVFMLLIPCISLQLIHQPTKHLVKYNSWQALNS
jgi:hypothetical protein